MIFSLTKLEKILIGTTIFVCTFALLFSKLPKAEAQFGSAGCNLAANFSQSVPVWDRSAEIQKNVQCQWNGIAWQLARIALHTLTQSVVNWINSGFNGSPSFLTDPESFFLDTADQMTGALIAAGGPLAQELCSPFSIDIRIALALGQTASQNQRYTCTLSQVIKTQQGNLQRAADGRLVNVSVDTNASSNSASLSAGPLQGFVGGDFAQGGWAGYLALSTNPQNTPTGAYLIAQSDLQARIQAQKNTINQDLNRGSGFLSWKKCENVPDYYTPNQGETVNYEVAQKSRQVCRTETPGSVISASLNKQLGASVDELNLTSEINQVVSALFSQLVQKTLSGGLYSSSKGSNGSRSYINQLANDPDLEKNFQNLKKQAVSSFQDYTEPLLEIISARGQIVTILSAQQISFGTARTCLATQAQNASLIDRGYYNAKLAEIDGYISLNITTPLNNQQQLISSASTTLQKIADMKTKVESTNTASDLSIVSRQFTSELSGVISNDDLQKAKRELDDAKKNQKDVQKDLSAFQYACAGVVTDTRH